MDSSLNKCRYVYLATLIGLGGGLVGCQGGAVYFEGGNNRQTSVDENTAGPVWRAVAKVEQSSPATFTYRLSGPDAEQFLIGANGDVSFRQTADYENPTDADKNNEYRVDIEASVNGQYAVQNLRINVLDVQKPQVALVQPKLFENVGTGNELEVATVVRVFDAESDAPINSLGVMQNNLALQQDKTDPSLWKGTLVVPEGGVEFSLAAALPNGNSLNTKAKLLNKRNSISPSFLGRNPGSYLVFFDPKRGSVGRLSVNTLLWEDYLTNPSLSTLHRFEFNSSQQTLYSINPNEGIGAIKIGGIWPQLSFGGCLTDPVANITYDNSNKRILILSQGALGYKLMSLATSPDFGFADPKPTNNSTPCAPAETNVVWDIPEGIIKGKFKDFNYHRSGKSFVLADERWVNGSAVTVIQMFSETGEKRSEVIIGADISNMTIDNAAGIIYVTERHSSAAGTLKAININSGLVTDLAPAVSGNLPGSYTQLRIDSLNKRLYIADDVSDAFFVVDLATNIMSELVYSSGLLPLN